MSNREERLAEDLEEDENDSTPVTGTYHDSSYDTQGANTIPVQSDSVQFDDPMQPPYSNSDKQLQQDEREAIDQSNILKGDRLRHAKPRTANRYNEGPDEDDLPAELNSTGKSSTREL